MPRLIPRKWRDETWVLVIWVVGGGLILAFLARTWLKDATEAREIGLVQTIVMFLALIWLGVAAAIGLRSLATRPRPDATQAGEAQD